MPNVNEATFERVHDTQFIYRQLLDAFAKPGQIYCIEPAAAKLTTLSPLQAMITCFAMTLFDGEVSFCLEMEGQEGLDAYLRRQTFSRVMPASQADHIITQASMDAEQIQLLLSKLRKGTLIRPEDGATVFLHVHDLETEARGDHQGWTLTGPGIQHAHHLSIPGLPKAWFEERAKLNVEYPLGIDMVLFTESGKMTALPRTTIVREDDI